MSQRKHPKYEYLTSRWGGMKLREEFEERIDNWLKAFDESEHKMLLSLLSQFYYYSEEKVKENSKKLYQKFLSENPEYEKATVFTKIIKDFGTSYSDILFNTFWLCNDLYDYCELSILELLENIEECEIPKAIAIIDDYSGSGKTFVKTIDKMVKKNACIGQAHFFFLTLHITNTAIDLIQNYAKITGFKIDIISLDISDKTFKDDYLYDRIEARKHRKQYEVLCVKNNINSNFVFGFDEIESLVAFHYNTPNNTLGLFWQDFADFMALFPRHKKQRNGLSEIQNNVRKRKKAKGAGAIYGFDDAKYALFMAYCVASDKKFSFEQAKADFGLNQEQLLDLIDRMIKEGYVVTQDGKFVATPKLKSNMFTTRLKNLKKSYTIDMMVEDMSTDFNVVPYVPKNF